jgi:hypothetical protein
MTKTLSQIISPPHRNQNILFSNIGNQNIFLEKKHNLHPPPLQVKWSFPNLEINHGSQNVLGVLTWIGGYFILSSSNKLTSWVKL